jgi:hypothetical protein
MASNEDQDLVRLATAANPVQAHALEQALKDEGIRCQVVGDYLDSGIGDIPGVQAEIWVKKADLPRAQKILDELEKSAETSEEEEPNA